MNHIGLFSGGGGFELVVEANRGKTIAFSEIEPFCRQILNYWFPDADDLGNIYNVNFKKYANTIDILTGGFPCQPFSLSGKRKGTDEERYLWPEMLRAVREIQPPWIVAENVYGIVNWSKGMVFEQVQIDLEAEGYQTTPVILPSISTGSIHERTRCWFIAYNPNFKLERYRSLETNNTTNSNGRKRNKLLFNLQQKTPTRQSIESMFSDTFQREKPSFPPLCSMDDGLPSELDGITFSKWVGQSNKMYGNAIDTHVFNNIYQTILDYERIISI